LKYHLILFMKKETMNTKSLQTLAVIGIASIAVASAASASTFTVYATGFTPGYGSEVSNTGGGQDGNFTLIQEDGTATLATPFVTNANEYPLTPADYTPDTATSQWISPQAGYAGGGSDSTGIYEYQTTFDLSSFQALSAVLNGSWAVDTVNDEILINGNVVPGTTTGGGFSAFSTYSAPNSDLVAGTNTIDFLVNNEGGGPTALNTFGSVTFVDAPEPSPVIALFVGLLGVGALMVRKRRIS
jgi:hypothetical protein